MMKVWRAFLCLVAFCGYCCSSVSAAAASDKLIRIPVYSALSSSSQAASHPITRKQIHDLHQFLDRDDSYYLESIALQPDQQRYFIQEHCGEQALQLYNDWQQQELFAVEVFKWCALSSQQEGERDETAMFLDATSPLVTRLQSFVVDTSSSLVVLADAAQFSHSMTTTLVVLQPQHRSTVARSMLEWMVQTYNNNNRNWLANPLAISQHLYQLVQEQLVHAVNNDKTTTATGNLLTAGTYPGWKILQQTCQVPWTATDTTTSKKHDCLAGFCCHIHNDTQTLLYTSFSILPALAVVATNKPYNYASGHVKDDEIPYMATVSQTDVSSEFQQTTRKPNLYDTLPPDCIDDDCSKCLRDKKKGATCDADSCGSVCACFCSRLCKDDDTTNNAAKPPPSQTWTVTPPLYSRDPQRWIPRIIHQTWFEELDDRSRYPNMSRMQESFRHSGWELVFYTDAQAASFLSTHFPAPVRQAYDALLPGAFKADLFRYCVLLIHGGVYADVDLQLESALDFSIPADVGFMVPMDEPGKPVNHQMCLWNGFIAAAPGHPVLAKAIETVVNQVRNRYTSVDVDATFCPNPELSVLHAYDTLFTAGPCLLGATLNRVLGRDGQSSFRPGNLDPWGEDFSLRQRARQTTADLVLGVDNDDDAAKRIPGRIVLLKQDKWDMGAHRFTLLERNLVVAATDLPDSNDRENLEEDADAEKKHEHYSKTHAKTGVYGVEHLYVDRVQAGEDIRIVVQGDHVAQKVVPTTLVANE